MTGAGISPVPREARPYQGHRAGLVTRLVAAWIDALVVGAVLLLGYLGLVTLRFLRDPTAFRFPDTSLLLSVTAGLVVLFGYLAVTWAVPGRTYGCHVMGLRVVGHRGGRLRPLIAVARALLCTFFPIGLLWCVWSRENRALHDVLLRTSVIYDWQPRRPGPAGRPP